MTKLLLLEDPPCSISTLVEEAVAPTCTAGVVGGEAHVGAGATISG